MAISFDAATDGTKTAATSYTIAFTLTGNLLLVGVNVDDGDAGDTVSGVTWNGAAMTRVDAVVDTPVAVGFSTYLYGLLTSDTGTHNVVVSLTGSYSSNAYVVWSYSGADGGLKNSTKGQNGSVGAYSLSLTPNTDNCWVVGVFGTGGTISSVAGSGTTKRNASSLKALAVDNNANISPAANTTLNITDGGVTNGKQGVIAAIAQDGAAGPANLKSLDTNVKANIKSYNTNVLANIKSINTNA